MKSRLSPVPLSGFIALVLLFCVNPTSWAIKAQEPGDEQEVHQMWERFGVLFQEGNSEAIGRLYTEDADRRNGQAEHARGRV